MTDMRAVALASFGGPEKLQLQTIPRPEPGPGEVLVRVGVAGLGEWDPFERSGGYAEITGQTPTFPYVLGSEGAGRIVALGEGVTGLREGDKVYAVGFLNPKGGFYADYVAIRADLVAKMPRGLTTEQAAVAGGVGLTALRGLEDVLQLQRGESVMIFGASGGMGHLALQIARQRGARVFAVASGDDGVALAERLGAELTVDGQKGSLLSAARGFAPGGLDAALLTAGGPPASEALRALREGGRAAWPRSPQPEPEPPRGVQLTRFDGEPAPDILRRFHRVLEQGPLTVHVSRVFPLAEAAAAHLALERHHLGKLALRVS